ncbi:MAG: DUF3817 domain-containing protein [Bdellovibrionales bacterium]|nr:DUF3817 domain-containing protein [Oligoflexia bacterium]
MDQKFKILGFAEGTSLLVLFGIAMPLKYLMNEPLAVRIVGGIHGGLFVAYVIVATIMAARENWSKQTLLTSYVLSTLPFGTFVFEKKFHQQGIRLPAKTRS